MKRDGKKRHRTPLTPERIAAVKDEDIDFSDIPECDEAFWREAKLVRIDRPAEVTLRLDPAVLAYFESAGEDRQSHMARVLGDYVRTRRRTG